MAFKKMTKKATLTMTGLVINLLLVIGLFSGMYLFFNQGLQEAGTPLDSKYEDIYANLSTSQSAIESNTNAIKTNLDGVKEADNTFESAWNGLKGLGNLIKLPISFLDDSLSVWDALVPGLAFFPSWLMALIFIGIIVIVVFLVIGKLTGEPKM